MRDRYDKSYDIGCLATIAVWSGLAIYVSASNPVVGLSDMFGFISRADALTFGQISPWVDGFYPFGYPLCLRALSFLVGDYELAGRVISFFSGAVILIAAQRIGRSAFGPRTALLAVIICSTNAFFLQFSTTSSTDMPATALLTVGTYFLCRFSSGRGGGNLFAGGASIGAAYMIRYTALTIVPCVIIWLWLRYGPQVPWQRRARQSIHFLVGFISVALPQFVLSFAARGNPFYNLQAQNVYFGMFGDGNWGLNMAGARHISSLVDVICDCPGRFMAHWYHNLHSIPGLGLVQFPLTLVSFAGVLFCLRLPKSRDFAFLSMLLLAGYTGTICMAFVNARVLLFNTVILSCFAAFGLVAFVPERLRLGLRSDVPVRVPLIATMAILYGTTFTLRALHDPLPEYDRNRVSVSETLHREGLQSSSEVLSFSFDYYDLSSPTKERFALPWYATDFEPYESVGDIALRMQKAGQRFLVLDNYAPFNIRGLSGMWPLNEGELIRHFDLVAVVGGTVHLYRLKPGANSRQD